jgi:SP family myo-inositol transporter-like MFS transporter 13
VGRRLLTLLSMGGVSLSLLIIAAAFFFTDKARAEAGQSSDGHISSSVWLIFFSICLYLVLFASGMGSTPWTVCSEIYPTSVRGVSTSITTSVNWTSNFIMSMSFLSIVSAFTEEGAFLLYSLLSFCFFVFFYKYLPETKEVPLENIPRLFFDDKWGKQRHCYSSVPSSEAAESLNAKSESDHGK